jgi:hypothetical protein
MCITGRSPRSAADETTTTSVPIFGRSLTFSRIRSNGRSIPSGPSVTGPNVKRSCWRSHAVRRCRLRISPGSTVRGAAEMHDIEEFIGWQPKPRPKPRLDPKMRYIQLPWEGIQVDMPGDYEALLGLMQTLAEGPRGIPTPSRARRTRPGRTSRTP